MKTPGQIAYEASTNDGGWESLASHAKARWERIAAAVLKDAKKPKGGGK